MAKPRKVKTGKPAVEAWQMVCEANESQAQALARFAIDPATTATITTLQFNKPTGERLSVNALAGALRVQVDQMKARDLSRGEAMLAAQAHTLDAIFNALASRAALNMGEYLSAAETYLRLALKAQSQCRTTLETLAAIQNPTAPTFVKQANIAHGPQQINNGNGSASPQPHAHGKTESSPNKLLEVTHAQGQFLDASTTQGAIGAHSSMAAVGAVHRP